MVEPGSEDRTSKTTQDISSEDLLRDISEKLRHEIPEIKKMCAEGRILQSARMGIGQLVRSEFSPHVVGTDNPHTVAAHYTYEPFINFEPPVFGDKVVLLTPDKAQHPIYHGVAERSLGDLRTFSFPLSEHKIGKVPPSLVVKGGDLFFQEGIEKGSQRALIDQIPGLGVLARLEDQYENASMLHGLSIRANGTHAGVPLPHSIREITDVPDKNGILIPIQDYLNSNDYLKPDKELALQLSLKKGEGLGDYLLERKQLKPAEYLYIIDGSNLRCREAISLLFFNHNGFLSMRDPLLRDDLALANGTAMESKGFSRDSVLRGAYRLLGDAWDIPLEAFLPAEPIQDENYGAVLARIRKRLAQFDVTRLVLTPFMERIVDTVALAHSHGWSFSYPDRELAGSLHPRNVTITGTICDLDTMTFGNTPYFQKDLGEAMLSIAAMQRIVSLWSPSQPGYSEHAPEKGKTFVDMILSRYREYAENYCQGDTKLLDTIDTLSRSDYLYKRALKLFYN